MAGRLRWGGDFLLVESTNEFVVRRASPLLPMGAELCSHPHKHPKLHLLGPSNAEISIEQAGSSGSRSLVRCRALVCALLNHSQRATSHLRACLIPSQVKLYSFSNQSCVFDEGSRRGFTALSSRRVQSSGAAPSPSRSVFDGESARHRSLTSVAEHLTATFFQALFNEVHPQIKQLVMGSDGKRPKQANKAVASKGAPQKSKSAGSRNKKGTTKKGKGSSENKRGSSKTLKMPADVDSGPEGEVSQNKSDM